MESRKGQWPRWVLRFLLLAIRVYLTNSYFSRAVFNRYLLGASWWNIFMEIGKKSSHFGLLLTEEPGPIYLVVEECRGGRQTLYPL